MIHYTRYQTVVRKMMLELREGHVLPGNVMKTLALSIIVACFNYFLT